FSFSSRRPYTRFSRDWSSDVCSSDLSPAISHFPYHLVTSATQKDFYRDWTPASAGVTPTLSLETGILYKINFPTTATPPHQTTRSEERRVGKDRRARASPSKCHNTVY